MTPMSWGTGAATRRQAVLAGEHPRKTCRLGGVALVPSRS
jgi:hypothetical protein